MPDRIIDGTGTSYLAKVDRDNRIHVFGTTLEEYQRASYVGDGYIATSGIKTLTSDNESAILYIRNNGINPIIISTATLYFGNSTGGSGDWKAFARFDSNVTGTIVTSGTALTPGNANLGSPRAFDGDVLSGGEGFTASNTAGPVPFLFATNGRYQLSTFVTVPKGISVAISIQPPAGNTSANVLVNSEFHVFDTDARLREQRD